MIDAPISPDILEETLKRNQDTEIVTLLAERLNIDAEEAPPHLLLEPIGRAD